MHNALKLYQSCVIPICISLFVASCAGPVSSPSPTPSPTLSSSQTPFPFNVDRYAGEGSSILTFPVSDLPQLFTFNTMGSTHSLVQAGEARDFRTIQLARSQNLATNDAGITSIELRDDELVVELETSEEWGLLVNKLSHSNFLAIPGGLSDVRDHFFVLEASSPQYLHLSWEAENKSITILTLDGKSIETLFSTTLPYDGWMPISSEVKAISIDADALWRIEIVDREELVD